MRKITFTISLIALMTLTLFYIIKIRKEASGVIRDVVVYEPSMSISSLYKEGLSFEKIDRTHPEGVLFCKTRTENTDQVERLYTASANSNKYMMEIIRNRETSSGFKKEISQKTLLLSFYYYGVHSPTHWFCLFESPDGTSRAVFFLEQENSAWRQGTDVAKYPVRIAFFDLVKKLNVFDTKRILSRGDIDAFIDDCRNIDSIITTGMAEDPEHYGPVQILK